MVILPQCRVIWWLEILENLGARFLPFQSHRCNACTVISWQSAFLWVHLHCITVNIRIPICRSPNNACQVPESRTCSTQNKMWLCKRTENLCVTTAPKPIRSVACSGCAKWCQRAHCMAGMGHRESFILRGRRRIWWRSVVCGMSLCVAAAVFGTLYTLHTTLYTLHSTLYTLHSPLYNLQWTLRHSTLYTPRSTLYSEHSAL